MSFDIGINEALQRLSSPFLDTVMKIFTEFGSEVFFIVVALIFYWCIDKKYAFRFISVFIAGHFCVEIAKGLVARPRPYTYDSVISIGEKTSGFAFPSGHSHSIANITTQVAARYKTKRFIIPLCALTLIVMLTRIYLGQHFLTDTIVGCAIGVAVALLLGKLWKYVEGKENVICYIACPFCIAIALILYFTGHAEKNFLVVLGAYSAFCVGYVVECKLIRFEVKSDKAWKHVIKVLLGVVVMLGAKEGLKLILPNDLFVMEFLRYFIVILFASCLLPLVFKHTNL